MEETIQEVTKTIKRKDMAYLHGLMEENMLATG